MLKKSKITNDTYSVLSTVGEEGIIIRMQLTRIVVMIKNENKGCTSMYIATRLIGLNGSNIQRASVAENLKISLPLLTTTKVWNKRNEIVSRRRFRSLRYLCRSRTKLDIASHVI